MIKEELTLRVTDLETKAIAFCREKDVPYPITKYLVAFATKVTKELQKENAELKEKLGDVQMQKAGEKSDLVWKLKTANEQKAEQLTKAKEIIKKLYAVYYDPCVTESDLKYRDELFIEIRQFISKVEK